MFPRAAPAGYLNVNGDMVFTKLGARVTLPASGARSEQRMIFQAVPGQNTVFGAVPGAGASVAAIQVYSVNNLTNPSGFRYGDIRTDGTAVTITSASLGPDSTATGAPTPWNLRFRVGSILHTIQTDGSWSFNAGQTVLDGATGNLTLTGNVQTPRIGLGIAPLVAVHIGVGGAIQFDRPDGTNQFNNCYVANDLLLTWNFNAGSTIMSLSSAGLLTAVSIGLGVAPSAAVHIGVGGSLRFDNSAATHQFSIKYHASLDRMDWAWDGGGSIFTVDSTGAVIMGSTLLVGGVLTALSTISVGGTTIAGTGNNAVMQRLAQVVCAGSQATVVFSSIPAGFTNLMIVFQSRDTLAAASISSVFLQMNADATAAHYDTSQQVAGVGSTASAAAVAPTTSGALAFSQPNDGSTAGLNSVGSILIPSYAGTTFFKQYTNTYQVINSTVTRSMVIVSAAWRQTTAITSLTFSTAGTAFKNGSTFTLYGMP